MAMTTVLLGRGSAVTPTIQSLGIDRLSVADRIRLVEDIWETIEADAPAAQEGTATDPPDWLKDLIDERIADSEANPNDVINSWAEAKSRILQRRARAGE